MKPTTMLIVDKLMLALFAANLALYAAWGENEILLVLWVTVASLNLASFLMLLIAFKEK